MTNGFRAPATTKRIQPKTNKPVKAIYKKARQMPKTKVGVNRMAINTLAKQVKTLQNQRFGPLQSNIIRHSWLPSATGVIPSNNAPICFMLNDFTTPKTIFNGYVNAGLQPGYQNWGNMAPQTFQSYLTPASQWNAQRNLATASKHQYKPISSRVTVNMDMTLPDSYKPARIRFTVLKVKPYTPTQSGITCALPYNLGAYINLAQEPGTPYRNFFYKKYHTILYDQTKIIRNNLDTELREITFNYVHRFSGTDVVSPHISNTPTGQTVYTNTSPKDQIWVLMSFEDNIGANLTSMSTVQYNVWRDQLGHGDITETLNTGLQQMQDLGIIEPLPAPEPEP